MEEKTNEILGWPGKMISGSKSGYHRNHPGNLVVFNANVILMESKPTKIWYGDLDLTLSLDKLKELSASIGQEIRVLREMDARFENEDMPLVNNFVLKVESGGSHELGKFDKEYYLHESLTRNNND